MGDVVDVGALGVRVPEHVDAGGVKCGNDIRSRGQMLNLTALTAPIQCGRAFFTWPAQARFDKVAATQGSGTCRSVARGKQSCIKQQGG